MQLLPIRLAGFLFIALAFCPLINASEEGDDLRAADAQLNTSYQEALEVMPTEAAKTKLRQAQRAWVAFRDAEIALNAELPGASGNILKMLQTELTETRTKQLQALAEAAQAE